MCHVSLPGTSSLDQHRSTFLPDSDGSSSLAVGGCRDLYEPFTATWMPRVVWWWAVTTHTSTTKTHPFHPFLLMCTQVFAEIQQTIFSLRRFCARAVANSGNSLDASSSLCSSVRTTFLWHSLNKCQVLFCVLESCQCSVPSVTCYLTAYCHSRLVIVLSM
jgi:hypothetical protein